ncbi:hypothetical protein AB6C96_18560 [Vibrio cyclitrophicus]|uniref:hypothetical protein n=1 Tax=unclassified Vibrio TaxID=2614977 RepID=UPI000976D127|nr:hypothetical protein [Vibrio sp. 10N.222.47.A9]OMO31405.1 hypothetical protein BH582_01440 [Vibrio sp. 10N.222.47.A9]
MTTEQKTISNHGRNRSGTFDDIFGGNTANQPIFTKPEALYRSRLDDNGSALSFVMNVFEKSYFHYIDTPEEKGYIQCNGENCTLCEAQIKLDHHILTPAYNFIEERMEILAIPPTLKPTSLAPQLKPLLNKGGLLVNIVKKGYHYEVTSSDIPAGIVIDKDKVMEFKEAYDSRKFALSDIYQIRTNEELETIPQIATRLILKRGRVA